VIRKGKHVCLYTSQFQENKISRKKPRKFKNIKHYNRNSMHVDCKEKLIPATIGAN
jgi:hypothetical protein